MTLSLEELKALLKPSIRRSTKLIVPKVTYRDFDGSLHNDDWEFKVPYAFRDALDIRYDKRMKNRIPYYVWTQGPCLNFVPSDIINSQDGRVTLSVTHATPAGWDSKTDEPFEGLVMFDCLLTTDKKGHRNVVERQQEMTQYDFVEFLMEGLQHYETLQPII